MDIKEKDREENEKENSVKKILIEKLDYIIVFILLFFLYIALIILDADETYRYLTFGFISLVFGSYGLKNSLVNKNINIVNLLNVITWLILALLQFVLFFINLQ